MLLIDKLKYWFLFSAAAALLLLSCGASRNLNDFFGIQMDEQEANNFKIVSYSDKNGANYYSNTNMNPHVYAYAEMDAKFLRIKVVNLMETKVKYNYNFDQFTLYTVKGEKFILLKGDRTSYPASGHISPNNSVQFDLAFPSDFAKRVGLNKPNPQDADYTFDIWKGDGSLNFVKQEVDYIHVYLGRQVNIILKQIPSSNL